MDPYARAAFDFSKAYLMNMRAADEQRRANQPSTNAFAEGVDDEETDYRYSPTPQAPAGPTEEYTGIQSDDGTALDQSNGSVLSRAKQKAAKYLQRA